MIFAADFNPEMQVNLCEMSFYQENLNFTRQETSNLASLKFLIPHVLR